MPNFPIRDLGQVGVVTDVSPYNLPVNGFSSGFNVRFDEGKVRRSPIFRTVKASLGFTPRFSFGVINSSAFDTVLMLSDAWSIREYSSGTVSDRSGSISGSSDPRPYTGVNNGNVLYLNRPDRIPVARLASATNFSDLANWDANTRCVSLRGFKNYLLALNTTESSTNFPTRVRWSNGVVGNAVPDSWDATDTTKTAGFNDLSEITSEIVDGMSLGSNFVIYASDSVWLMEFVGGTFIFNFRKLFTDTGAISQNCIVEVEGKHFVFGNTDIYMHDGTSKQSISDERVRRFIFDNLNVQNNELCFVQHNPNLNEIYFCYKSGDSSVNFPNATRCNRAAVYNYTNNTWSFMDIPNVSSATNANVDTVLTYNNASNAYNVIGGTYYDQEDSYNRQTLFVGEDNTTDGLTSDKLYGLDLADEGSMAFALDTEATKAPIIERTGIDLDETDISLSQYKVIKKLYPQINTNNTDKTIVFQFGASDIPNSTPTYSNTTNFNSSTDYKIDSRVSGRYLSYKMYVNDNKDFELSGFDLDVEATGKR